MSGERLLVCHVIHPVGNAVFPFVVVQIVVIILPVFGVFVPANVVVRAPERHPRSGQHVLGIHARHVPTLIAACNLVANCPSEGNADGTPVIRQVIRGLKLWDERTEGPDVEVGARSSAVHGAVHGAIHVCTPFILQNLFQFFTNLSVSSLESSHQSEFSIAPEVSCLYSFHSTGQASCSGSAIAIPIHVGSPV